MRTITPQAHLLENTVSINVQTPRAEAEKITLLTWTLTSLSILFVSILCARRAMFAVFAPASWSVLNGDVQEYNQLARVIGGDIPYVDFVPYLGVGQILAGLPAFLAAGGTFGGSIASQAIMAQIFGVLFFVAITWLCGLRGHKMAAATAIALLVTLIPNTAPDLWAGAASATSERAFGPLLFVMLCFSVMNVAPNASSVRARPLILAAIAAVMALWSNDAMAAIAVMGGLLSMWIGYASPARNARRKILGAICCGALYSVAYITVLSIIVLAPISSEGSILSQILTIAEWQSWYYTTSAGQNASGFMAIWRNTGAIRVVLWVCAIATAILTWRARSPLTTVLLVILLLGGMIQGLVATIGGNPNSRYFTGLDTASVAVIASILVQRSFSTGGKGLFRDFLYCLALAFYSTNIAPNVITQFFDTTLQAGVDIPGIGRIDPEHALIYREITRIAAEEGADPVLFSQYRGPFEIQTSKTYGLRQDYLIHAFGERDRRRWIDLAKRANIGVTISPSSSGWAIWVEAANWDVMRPFYEGFEISANVQHNLIWRRATTPGLDEGPWEKCKIVETTTPNGSHVASLGAQDMKALLAADRRMGEIELSLEGVDGPAASVLVAAPRSGHYSGVGLRPGASTLSIPWRSQTGAPELVTAPGKMAPSISRCRTRTIRDRVFLQDAIAVPDPEPTAKSVGVSASTTYSPRGRPDGAKHVRVVEQDNRMEGFPSIGRIVVIEIGDARLAGRLLSKNFSSGRWSAVIELEESGSPDPTLDLLFEPATLSW